MASYFALIDGKTGAYGVWFPDLPGCTAMGATIDEAVANAADAMRDWAEVTLAKGDAIPEPRALEALLSDSEVCGSDRRGRAYPAHSPGPRDGPAGESQPLDRCGRPRSDR